MSHVIAVTGKRLNRLVDIYKPETNIHKNHEEILSTE
jgi:hypothetical protein